jgi:hypothetical protein
MQSQNWACESVSMTEADAIRTMRRHIEGLFPKVCPNCHRRFASLREYVLAAKPLGSTISYDVETGDWTPLKPLGTAALANCPCGTTLSLTSEGMPVMQMWHLLNWARGEMKLRNISGEQLLDHLRAEIRKQVLAEAAAPDG